MIIDCSVSGKGGALLICPNCGAEIPDGLLLCEACGREIQIVPDFDPEVEDSITKSLSDVADELTASGIDLSVFEDREENKEEQDDDIDLAEHHTNMILRIGGILILAMIIIVVIMSIRAYRSSSAYLLSEAEKLAAEGNYAAAIEELRNSNDGTMDYAEMQFRIAEYYSLLGDETSYVNTLQSVIRHQGISLEDSMMAYELLIEHYAAIGNFDQINNILQSCNDTTLTEKYSEYMASPPQFNYVEGSYNVVVPLKILSNTTGTIYYTLDGSEPTTSSEQYTSPIFLENGNYIVTALFVNDYGVVSPLAKSSYKIDVTAPFSPEVDAYSGTYYTPQLIHVTSEEDCTIYYTVDGDDPTMDSTLYNGFLTMPLGEHTLKFVAVDENLVYSSVVTRTYDLELLTDYTTDDAMTVILDYLKASGKTTTRLGTLADNLSKRMSYSFACCVNIPDEGDFYIFSEYIYDVTTGVREKTGNYYAVGVYNMPLYTTAYSGSVGTFILTSEQLNAEDSE